MTASELYEALQGVPAEALCVTIRYYPNPSADGWWVPDNVATPMPIAHAAALQRDAMTEWLYLNDRNGMFGRVVWFAEKWSVRIDSDRNPPGGFSFHPTRLHALAAACKYVKEQEGK